ncbi:MAG: competence protein ComE [Oscillatoriophycideae cyanobacterium NC_groundwater_1537_Pr4_S-0.65um_50_18]|nr:competence protein ComE [Oscillatoriophycideae cyanobacterium NC_groundwater_1537_Pr4_S-0.65um_50_18]
MLLGLLLFLGFNFWRQTSAPAPASPTLAAPLPQDPLIQVYFNHAQSASYTEPYRQQQRLGDDLEAVVVEAIASAQSSLQVAVHELNLPQVAQALAERKKAGVAVRVIVENTYSRPMSSVTPQELAGMESRDRQKYQEFVQLVDQNQDGELEAAEVAERDALTIFKAAGIPVIDDTADGSKGSSLMHHKFLVIDRQTVIVGSANLTLSDVHGDFLSPASQGNANHLLKITSPELAQHFATEFDWMWGDGVGGRADSKFGLDKPYRSPKTFSLAKNSTVTVQFSPTSSRLPWQKSSNGLIGRTLSRATRTVNLALFVFSDQALGNILETNRDRGVQIKALIEPQFAYREYSEGLDLMGVALPGDRCRYEPENRPWRKPLTTVGVPVLADGDLLHHKMGVIDGKIVITGSQNWSAAANDGNDENVLVIDNATVAAHFQQEFDRLYQGAALGIPPHLQQKMQKQRSRCRLGKS